MPHRRRRRVVAPPPGLRRARLAAALLLLTSAGANAQTPQCNLDASEERTVTRVVDGETLIVDGGGEVRLLGALAPQAFDTAGGAQEWPLAETARAELDRLLTGRSVTLAFAGRRNDRYGRLLAHVFVTSPQEGDQSRPRIWVQGEMLRKGHARAYALEPNAQCIQELVSHEALARTAAAGLWSDAAYSVRSSADVPTLLRLSGTFQIVEGRVRATGDVRGVTYLNFGEDFRQDFTVVIRPAVRRALAAAGTPPDAFDGALVRVRGWIERRGGPLIEVAHASALELLAPKSAENATGAQTASPGPARRSRRRADPRQ